VIGLRLIVVGVNRLSNNRDGLEDHRPVAPLAGRCTDLEKGSTTHPCVSVGRTHKGVHNVEHTRGFSALPWLGHRNSALCWTAQRAFSRAAVRSDGGIRFAHDSLLEEDGFELLVPPAGAHLFAANGDENKFHAATAEGMAKRDRRGV